MTTTVKARISEPERAPQAGGPWYRDRNRLVVAGVAAVVVLALVGWLVLVSGKRKEAFAARSLNQARAQAEAGNLPLASSELQKVITTYGGTAAAKEAVITLNQVRLINGQDELAAVGLKDFVARDPGQAYATPAYGLMGAALENSRRWVEAAEAYQRASALAGPPYLKAKYLVDAGRAYRLAGRRTEAATAYRTVLEKYGETPSLTEAQVRLAELTDGKM